MLQLTPSDTRYVDIVHREWDARWRIQFPESIASDQGQFMDFQPISPHWESHPDGGWGYVWDGTPDYVSQQKRYQQADPRLAEKRYLAGIRVSATIRAAGGEIHLRLVVENRRQEKLTNLICDGGCFQALDPRFTGEGEVSRSYVRCGGNMVPVHSLGRSVPERSRYCTDKSQYRLPAIEEGRWFWGTCERMVDRPVIMGMASKSREHAVVIGYRQGCTGTANADMHHCLHSTPHCDGLEPGDAVTFSGLILFGSNVELLGNLLQSRLQEEHEGGAASCSTDQTSHNVERML